MDNQTDQQLLRDYAGLKSDAAFAELVRRHIDFVYSAALRMVRDSHLAEDVTQAVFLGLAQNAPKLMDRQVLAGWLHRTTQNLAANVVRADVRRRTREQEAATMNQLLANTPEAGWEHVASHLDDALTELNEADRDAVLLRYFERKSAREVAAILGGTEEAAQKRVSRAVDRLRELFARRGIALGAGGLVTAISANAVQAAPAGLAVTISSAAALSGVAATTSTALTATKAIAMTTLQKTLIATALVAGVTTLVVQHQSQANLRQENQSLRNQLTQIQSDSGSFSARLARAGAIATPKLPAPAFTAPRPPASSMPDESLTTNMLSRLTNGPPKLTLAQLDPYLAANRRNAASLLAAYRCSGDPALLAEAMQRFPNNPQVAFEAAFRTNATPQEKQQWLEALKKSDPGNSLPNYLLANGYFKSGQADQAVQELIAASGKSGFLDYTRERMQDDEEAYLAAGYSAPEAKTIPAYQTLLPQLKELKDAGISAVDLAKAYRDAGDNASAQAVLALAANLGQRYKSTPGETEISYLVGMAIENIALKSMDPNSPYGSNGQTVQLRIDEIAREKAMLKELSAQYEAIIPKMSDIDWMLYKDRWRVFGEEAALRWVIEKYSQK